MKTLCMDSSHKYLVLGLYEDNQLIACLLYTSTAMLNQGLCRFFSAREAQALATTYFHIHND